MSEKIKVAGYIRVSTHEQAKEGESLELQEKAIGQYAAYRKYELVKIYRDEGVSGAKVERPGLTAMRKDAENKKFQKVIFKKLSRFGRSARNLLELYEEFGRYEVDLISIEEGISTDTPSGKLQRNVLSSIAEFERDTIGNIVCTGS